MAPVNQPKETKPAQERAITLRVTEKVSPPRESFSSATQYAEVLIPSFLGVLYMVFSQGFGTEQFFIYGLFLFGIGAALITLKGIETVEKSNH